MKTLTKSKGANVNSFTGAISHIRFWAVQLCQGRCFEKPLPLAQRRPATLTRARGPTGQGLGTDSQRPGCIWSVCSWKNERILAVHASARKMSVTRILRGKICWLKSFQLKRWSWTQGMQNTTPESLRSAITWAAEQVLRRADAFSSTCERTKL